MVAPLSTTIVESLPRKFNESKSFKKEELKFISQCYLSLGARPASLPFQPIVNEPKRPVESNNSKMLPPTIPVTTATKPPSTLDNVTKPLSTNERSNDSMLNDNLTNLISEQRRQNRLLEQVIAAINTTNALLTQLVQR
jgi:hypothetical protein